MAREYPGRPFNQEDLEKLGANYSVSQETSSNYGPRTNEPVVYNPHGLDVDPSELPEHHVELTQLSLKRLCNIIGGYFREAFVDFAGCEMRYDAKNGRPETGFLVFNLVFEWKNGYSEPSKFNALVRYDRPADTIIDLEKRFRTLDLTPEAKGFLMKYMSGLEYNNNGKPFVQWNKFLEEKDLNGRTSSGYTVNSSLLVITNVDLNKVVQDIWTAPDVKRADEEAAIKAWKRSHWKLAPKTQEGKEDKNKQEFIQGPETDDEILSMCRINRKYNIVVTFKGYQRLDPNGNISFSNVPLNIMANGQVQQGMVHDFEKYLVNVKVSNVAQIVHDFPIYSQNNTNSDFLLNLI